MPRSNNPGNILAGQSYAGQTPDTYTGATSGLTYTTFDSPEMGLRAIFKDVRKKLKDFDNDVEDVLLKYLGGDEGTKEQKYAKAATHNEDPKGYIQRGIKAYEEEGERGLVKQIVINENLPEHRDYYLDNTEAMDLAEKLSILDLPQATTFTDALEVYNQGEYHTGGMVQRNPYPYNPRPI